MKIIQTEIPEVLIVKLDIHKDDRGYFVERFNEKKFKDLGLDISFVQDNHSKSKPGVLRGLHYQVGPSQGKLVSCVSGEIQDVAVDIRPESPTYKKYVAVNLSEENGYSLWIPKGFAHGFCVVGDQEAHVVYKVDELYNATGDRGIRWNDNTLNIIWYTRNPIVSTKDKSLPFL